MTNTAAAPRTIARLAIIVLGAVALMLGLGAISEAQAAPTAAPVIEAGIPEDHECVLHTADGTAYRVVADTDPRCKVQGQEAGLDVDGQRRCLAAELVLTRITDGGRVGSDWTWTGAPYVVAEQNDNLVTDMRDAGYGYDSADALQWLTGKVGACGATYGPLTGEED